MSRITLIRDTSENEGDKKNSAKRRIRTTVLPPPKLPQVLTTSQQLFEHAQHQIKLLVEQNIDLQHALIELGHKETRARYSAYHDELTGLPNRSLLQDRFRQFMCHAERHHKPLALLMLDLDEFKYVNDKLGHASGDKLLQAVARRLTKGIRGADTACRYGGDEFVVMLADIESPSIAAALAVEIGGRLREPYFIDAHKINMAVSIGVAVYPGDGHTFDALMKQADIAMYCSKAMGHNTSITKDPAEKIGLQALSHLPAPQLERKRERDLFIQDEFAHKHQALKNSAKCKAS